MRQRSRLTAAKELPYNRRMRVLYIGGSGEISFDCIHESVRLGHDVSVYNRGNHNLGLPSACRFIKGDITDDAAYGALARERFDVICQFRLFTPEEIRRDIELFTGHCGRYVFISTCSAYQKPVRSLPITERTPLDNPHWLYSRNKAAMEALLTAQRRLPFVIVRPSLTYRTRLPSPLWPAEVSRMLRGKPVVRHGDGESLWTATHAEDFARPFARLIGSDRALGEAFHITADGNWTWNEIFRAIAAALKVEPRYVHVPSETLVRYHADWEGPLFGDKTWSVAFDNSKVKSVVGDFACKDPWAGTKLVAERYPPSAEPPDAAIDALLDRIAAEQLAVGR